MNSQGPLPRFLSPFGYLAARAYHLGWSFDVRRQLHGGPARVGAPVISIGNLTVGGTGKTPFCSLLADGLHEAGASPAIAMRGYRADRTGGSDEAEEYRQKHPWLPVLVGADRVTTIREALARKGNAPDVILLDDGFQHRRLHRDLDIVLVDALRPGLDGDLLPNGWLREPARSLERADLVVVTRSGGDDGRVHDLIRRHRGVGHDATCRHGWSHIDVYESGVHKDVIDPASCPGRKVVVCSGLGNPASLVDHVTESGMNVVEHLAFSDHVHYGPAELESIRHAAAGADAVLTSAKDWVKLARSPGIESLITPVLVPVVRIEFLEGRDVVVERIREACGTAPVL